ncbi:MAG TPA: DUF3800 domain-containing protein, partial [Sedimentisphaerales bacterium]|nr:DUF3800 domain-containing protein [Sedimentisphaerales bacterium]
STSCIRSSLVNSTTYFFCILWSPYRLFLFISAKKPLCLHLISYRLLGAVWCPADKAKSISKEIRILKQKHNARGELKWKKVSESRSQFYEEVLDYFFGQEDLNFRCVVVVGKDRLNHDYFNQGSHESFYYKMYYYLLLNIVSRPDSKFNIYLDIKDTRGSRRIRELRRILHTKLGDQEQSTIPQVQLVRSHESELVQLTDFLTGAVGHCNRNDIQKKSPAKLGVIRTITTRTATELTQTSPPWEDKFNVFIFHPRRLNHGRPA